MKKLLLVVDFQNDFVNGSLGFDGAELLDERIVTRINECRQDGWDVAYTFDTHTDDYLETQEGSKLPISHCIKDSNGWKLYGKVADMVKKEDKLFYKPSFGSLELIDYLQSQMYETVELVGLVTNICIISNAIIAKTALPEAEIIVNERLVASYDKDLHNKSLDVMKGLQVSVVGA